jgi:ElaB/YqjD/DUF883 family membrane-anchored ribosome-binding protein
MEQTNVKSTQPYDKTAGNGGAQRSSTSGFDTDQSTIARAKSSAHDAVDRIADSASQAAAQLGVKADQIKEWQQNLAQTCSQYVREKPLQSLGIAVASGFILSRVLFR